MDKQIIKLDNAVNSFYKEYKTVFNFSMKQTHSVIKTAASGIIYGFAVYAIGSYGFGLF